jgi:hypothetical protein
MVSEPMPPDMQSMEAEESRISTALTMNLFSLHLPGRHVRIVSTRYDPRSQTWYIGTIGNCGGQLPDEAFKEAVRAQFRKYTTAPVDFEKGGFGAANASAKDHPFAGCHH